MRGYLWAGLMSVLVLAGANPGLAQRTLPGAPCLLDLPGDSGWSDAEHWAWAEICAGRPASMTRFAKDGKTCNPASIKDEVPEGRILSARFLRLILTQARFSDALERPQVFVQCAQVTGALDLEDERIAPGVLFHQSHLTAGLNAKGARFDRSVYLNQSVLVMGLDADEVTVGGGLFLSDMTTVKGGVSLESARVAGNLSADATVIDGDFHAGSAEIGGSLSLSDSATVKGEANLLGVRVAGDVDASGVSIAGDFEASSAEIGGGLYLRGAASVTGEVRLLGARVAGNIEADGSSFESDFNAGLAQVSGNLFLTGQASFKGAVHLLGTGVAGNVETDGSSFEGTFYASGAEIGGNLFLRGNALFHKAVVLSRAQIGGDVQLGASNFDGAFVADGARVGGTLEISSADIGRPIWGKDADLVLRNASAGALQADLQALRHTDHGWVKHDLAGLRYDDLGALDARSKSSGTTNLAHATPGALIGLIERRSKGGQPNPDHDANFNPQPYAQLAKALDAAGATTEAQALRFAAFEHKRRGPDLGWIEWAELWAGKLIYGYGIYPFRVLWWFGALVLAGTVVGKFSCSSALCRWWPRLVFSVENALPLVEPQAGFRSVTHDRPWVDGFFHIQKVAGFLLATILVGALTFLGGA